MSFNRNSVPCMIIRGGTSKGVYFLEKDVPAAGAARDQFLLRLMGSPDKKQIDGLGGAASVTSKAAILAPSEREDADVDYTFAQVSVDKALVSYAGNCGNISSGVGAFALERRLVALHEGINLVRIFNTNTQKIIHAEVLCENGQVKYDGNYVIAGVPGSAAPVKLSFLNPAGAVSGRLLPTGHAIDILDVPDFKKIEVSIVDAANPLVFARAQDLGLKGTELPQDIDGNPKLSALLERIRGAAAVLMGLTKDWRKSAWDTPGVPKMTFVSPVQDYSSSTGAVIPAESIDLVSRMMSMQKAHPTYALTGALCTAAAAVIPGSVVNQALGPGFDKKLLRIGHPGGIIEAGIDYSVEGGSVIVHSVSGFRTARLLMDGMAYY